MLLNVLTVLFRWIHGSCHRFPMEGKASWKVARNPGSRSDILLYELQDFGLDAYTMGFEILPNSHPR